MLAPPVGSGQSIGICRTPLCTAQSDCDGGLCRLCSLTKSFDRIAHVFCRDSRMLSPGTQTCAHVEHTHAVACQKVFACNAPMWSAGTHQEHTIIHRKHSCVHPQHAACGLIKRTRALRHAFLSLKHTCLPAEYTSHESVTTGDKYRETKRDK